MNFEKKNQKQRNESGILQNKTQSFVYGLLQRTRNQIDIGDVDSNIMFKMKIFSKASGKECGAQHFL